MKKRVRCPCRHEERPFPRASQGRLSPSKGSTEGIEEVFRISPVFSESIDQCRNVGSQPWMLLHRNGGSDQKFGWNLELARFTTTPQLGRTGNSLSPRTLTRYVPESRHLAPRQQARSLGKPHSTGAIGSEREDRRFWPNAVTAWRKL